MIETNVSRRQHDTFLQVVQSYYQLTKPRIIPLLLITTAGSMWIAAKGEVDPWLLIITMIGGTLAAASAQTINCIYDRDIDYDMERTRHRPIPSGKIQSRDALIFCDRSGCTFFYPPHRFCQSPGSIFSLFWHHFLCFSLYSLAQTPYHSKYRHWWCSRGNSRFSRLGSSNRHFKLVCVANFCHCLFVDTSPFLGFGFND